MKQRSTYGAFTFGVKSVLNENLGGILGSTQCYVGDKWVISNVFFFWVKNCQISPKNLDQPLIGLDFCGEIWVFSPKTLTKPLKVA
jgi:hypothetical protein